MKARAEAAEESAGKLGEALRRELASGVIGGCGEARECPGEVTPFVEAVELAGAEDGVEDGRAPAVQRRLGFEVSAN